MITPGIYYSTHKKDPDWVYLSDNSKNSVFDIKVFDILEGEYIRPFQFQSARWYCCNLIYPCTLPGSILLNKETAEIELLKLYPEIFI